MGGGRGGRRGGGGGGEGGPRGGKSSEGEDGRVANIRASNEPPVRLHLRLTNHGTESATIEVLDFNSDLGNFVVQPAKLMVPPGASVEAEPMTSRLGIRSAAIPLTVRLRANGQVEKQVLDLKVLSPVEADSSGPATGTAPAPVTPP